MATSDDDDGGEVVFKDFFDPLARMTESEKELVETPDWDRYKVYQRLSHDWAVERGCKPPMFEAWPTLIAGGVFVHVYLLAFLESVGAAYVSSWQVALWALFTIGPVAFYFWSQRKNYDDYFSREHDRLRKKADAYDMAKEAVAWNR